MPGTISTLLQAVDLPDLRKQIQKVLCEFNLLEPGAFPFTERVLTKQGEACGIMFCLHGPRSVKLTAIWETVSNSVLFYDSTGQRQGKAEVDLDNQSDLLALAS
jgi:hypothetical protein